MPENLNVEKLMIRDDKEFLYIAYEVEGLIDFSQNPDLPSEYNYHIYLNTTREQEKGYVGGWWKTSFGTNYSINNGGIFQWDDSQADRTDYNGWKWIGLSGMTCRLNEDRKRTEYCIEKENLGGLKEKELKVFLQVEESRNSIGNLLQPFNSGKNYYDGFFVYTLEIDRNSYLSDTGESGFP